MAGLIVGQRPHRYAIFFLLADGWQLEELDFALNTIRASLDARLVDARVRGSFREAAEIQQSLLVEEPPEFAGYELAARSVAADEVGRRLLRLLRLRRATCSALAIGDASGHGLPAALLVRDVVTGLRMGIEKELKVAHVFEKLNRVIHRSRLSSRFVSVFYGELERGREPRLRERGPPAADPVLPRAARPGRPREMELSIGGTVIGPLPEARFRRGFARLHPGEVLLMLTDGILERRDKAGEFFGVDRVRGDRARACRTQPAQAILDAALRRGVRLGRRAALGGRRDDRRREAGGRARPPSCGQGVSASSAATRASMLATVVRPSRRKRTRRRCRPAPACARRGSASSGTRRARAARRARRRSRRGSSPASSSGTPRPPRGPRRR